MSILIKGATKQQVMKVLINSTEWLPDDIEVIEIPTPHGRLIDAEVVNSALKKRLLAVDTAPTVIEAEDREHERNEEA